MPKLILHIGTHKTGTTSLQGLFFQSRHLLWEKGIYYPDMGRGNGGHHGLVTPWIALPEIYHLEARPREFWKSIAAYGLENDKTVFLSTEEFSRKQKHQVDFAEVRGFFEDYDDVEVMCTLRDQASFIQSIYLQITKTSKTTPWHKFLENALRTNTASGLFLDYNELDDYLLKYFERDEITYISYAQASNGNGIAGEYAKILGLNYQEIMKGKPRDTSANISPGPLAYFIANRLARDQVPTNVQLEEAAKVLIENGINPRNTSLFSRREFSDTERHFKEKNEKFKRRILHECRGEFFYSRISLDSITFRDDLDYDKIANTS